MNELKPLTETEVVSAVEQEISAAIGYTADGVVSEQTDALKRYLGEPYGDEVTGRSQMVDRTVMDTVEQAMPSIMRVFASAEKLAQFEPVMPSPNLFPNLETYQAEVKKRVEQSDQATDYCNWIFFEDNQGFLILHDWFKDSLIQKNGIVKMWWDVTEEVRFQSFTKLPAMAITKLVSVDIPGAEIVAQAEAGVDPAQGPLFDVKLKIRRRVGRVKIEPVPPEEFMISRQARSVTDTNTVFSCHRYMKSRSDLIAMGFDPAVVQELPSGNFRISQQSNGSQVRFSDETSSAFQPRTGQNTLIEVFETYLRIDEDGDGIAELRQIIYAGHKILRDTEVTRCPFYSVSPIRIPHKFFGLSYADMTGDLQRLKTALWRQMLDNLYGTNAPELAIGPGVNMDDALSRKVRGVIRTEDVNQLRPILIPFTAGESFPMLSYVDEQRRQRTGVAADMGALSPEQLKRVTAEGISEMMSMARSRPELVARIFAETGIKDLFSGMIELIRDNQDYIRVVKLRGGYVPMDPRDWDADMTVKCRIGMGYSSDNDRKAALNTVMALQGQIAAAGGAESGIVTPMNLYNAATDVLPLMGLPDTTRYFNPPAPPSDGPSPEEKAAMMEIASTERIEAAKIKSKQTTDALKIRTDAMLDQMKILLEDANEKAELVMEAKLEMAAIKAKTASGQGKIPNPA